MTYEPVPFGKKVKLNDKDANDTPFYKGSKEEAQPELLELNERLEHLQELLYAEGKHKVLVILQAMDAGGKDGVVRRVFEGVNPQGVRAYGFKVPNAEELSHDYLWRIHKQTPKKGEMVIFNRGQYEDVLAVRVLNLMPKDVWEKRFDHINNFEKMLADEGTLIIKFFLQISKDEQKERFMERLINAEKHWKFNPGDLSSRDLWDQYMKAYEDVLEKTSTDWAPWYIVPSDRKWYRDLMISRILVEKLEGLKMDYPKALEDFEPYKKKLESE